MVVASAASVAVAMSVRFTVWFPAALTIVEQPLGAATVGNMLCSLGRFDPVAIAITGVTGDAQLEPSFSHGHLVITQLPSRSQLSSHKLLVVEERHDELKEAKRNAGQEQMKNAHPDFAAKDWDQPTKEEVSPAIANVTLPDKSRLLVLDQDTPLKAHYGKANNWQWQEQDRKNKPVPDGERAHFELLVEMELGQLADCNYVDISTI